jgi:hypothetical protein
MMQAIAVKGNSPRDPTAKGGQPERKRQSGSDRGIPLKLPLSLRRGIPKLRSE